MATSQQLLRIERSGIARYCLENIHEPAVLCVDPLAVQGFAGSLWLMFEQKHIFNIISLADYDCLFPQSSSDALCLDANSKLNLVVVLVTSQCGENLLAQLERKLEDNCVFRIKVIRDMFGLVHDINGGGLFTLTLEPCVAPTWFMFGNNNNNNNNKCNAFELDVQEDLPQDYRTSLKRIATCVSNAVYRQIGWDVQDQIFSIGFGSSLLGNTIHRMVEEEQPTQDYSLVKASLLIVDRTMDWASVFPEENSHSRLHDQLGHADQTEEIVPQIISLLQRKLCTAQEAFGLAVRAVSKFTSRFDFAQDRYMDEFAYELGNGVSGDQVAKFLHEIALAQANCCEEGQQEVVSNEKALIPAVLEQCYLHGTFPSCVKHANPNPFNVFKMLSSGAGSKAGEFRARKRVVVFILGGASKQDLALIQAVASYGHESYLITTTNFATNQEVENELFAQLQQAKQPNNNSYQAKPASSPRRQNFAKLFNM